MSKVATAGVLGLVPRELRVAVPAGAAVFDCLRACRTVAASLPDAQITALPGVDHDVAATMRLLVRERDKAATRSVVLPVAAGLSSTGSSRVSPAGGRSAVCSAGGRRGVPLSAVARAVARSARAAFVLDRCDFDVLVELHWSTCVPSALVMYASYGAPSASVSTR
jgi:hypothetical protein